MALYFESREIKGRDTLLTFRYEPGWLARLFGSRPGTRQFIGNCTVWNHYPSFRRCGTLDEMWLCDVWKRERYKAEHGL